MQLTRQLSADISCIRACDAVINQKRITVDSSTPVFERPHSESLARCQFKYLEWVTINPRITTVTSNVTSHRCEAWKYLQATVWLIKIEVIRINVHLDHLKCSVSYKKYSLKFHLKLILP